MTEQHQVLDATGLAVCPFCGKSDKLVIQPYRADDDGGEPFDWGFNIICSAAGFERNPNRGCGASGSWGETEDEAIAAWNRRAPPPPSEVRETGEAVERDIYECANQLMGYVGPDTEERLAQFLIREGKAAAVLADEIVNLRDLISTQEKALAEMREALRPFAQIFEDRRDAYSRRHADANLGYRNFDKMPDWWLMDKVQLTMGDFRRARQALKGDHA